MNSNALRSSQSFTAIGVAILMLLLPCIDVWAASPKHSRSAKNCLKELNYCAKNRTPMFGHQDDILYGHSFRYLQKESEFVNSDVVSVCGDYPAVLGLDLGRTEVSDINLDYQRLDNIISAAITHFRRGGVVTISWHADNPVTGKDSWDIGNGNTVETILHNPYYKTVFDERLKRIGDILNQMRDDRGVLIPILFRPYHENNLEFWWGGKGTDSETFKRLWIYTYNYLVNKRGLKNLLWVYSPYMVKDESYFMSRYPGDKYVDILSYEQYQHNGEPSKNYIESVNEGINFIVEISKRHKKVPVIAECGLMAINQPQWWTSTFETGFSNQPIAYVLVWRNGFEAKSEYYVPFKGSSSEQDFMQMYNNNSFLFLKSRNKYITKK